MKILIVDDELVSRKKIDKLIQGLGYETLVATDGAEAWEIWKNENPRIVITDWIMPGIDGLDLCRKIREAEGSLYTYLIMVTSKKEVNDIVVSMDAGADDFITKPFVKEELAVRIRAGERILGFETRDIVIFSMANLAEALDRARRSLGTLRQQLLESERLTTIGQLAAQLAHKLRNPLASIRAAAQLAATQ